MTALNFPDAPTNGQIFDKWTWDGFMWVLTPGTGGGGGGSGFTFNQDAQPTATKIGDTWFETDTGDSFVWTNDGNSTQWVQFAPGSGGSNGGGKVAYAQVTAPQTGIGATITDLTGLSTTFTAIAGHEYLITAEVQATATTVNGVVQIMISDGNNVRNQLAQITVGGTASEAIHVESRVTPAAGSTTYKLRMYTPTASTTCGISAGADYPCFIMVEDITYGVSGGGGGGGGGGSGFTFVQETAPTPTKVGDTWFDLSTAATGGTSWVAVEEGAAGSEKVWVQFAPGTGASLNRSGSWTPTPGSSVVLGTGGTLDCRYSYVPGQLMIDMQIKLGTSGFSVTGTPNIPLPPGFAASNQNPVVALGVGVAIISGGSYTEGVGRISSTNSIEVLNRTASGTYIGRSPVTSTAPATWIAGDGFYINGSIMGTFI